MKELLLRCCLLTLVIGCCFVAASPAQTCNLTGRKIFVDAGHGGTDPGAIGPTGLREKDVNLDAALRLRAWLQGFGATVEMSRTTDIFIPLATRADLANASGAHRFISIHSNSFTAPSANGTETYTAPNPSATTRDLGQQSLNYLLWYLGLRNRGLKTANFTVLLRTSMPAVLSETAFISNPAEEALLADPVARDWIAEAHAYAICQHLGPAPASRESSTASTSETDRPAYVRDGQIWIERGDAETRLTSDDLVYSDVKVSPAGDKLLAVGSDFTGSRLFVIDAATGERRNLSLFGIGRETEQNLSYEGFWSPDGRRVLVLFARDDGHEQVAADLYLFDTEGEGHVRLTNDGAVKLDPAWAGDARVTYQTSDGKAVTVDLP